MLWDEVDENNVPYQLPQWLHGRSCLLHMKYRCSFVHHVPKCMSCNEAIDVITGRTHCFHDCIYIMPVLLRWDLSNVCRGSLMATYAIYTYIDSMGVNKLTQVWNIAHHFCLSCILGAWSFRCTFECDPY